MPTPMLIVVRDATIREVSQGVYETLIQWSAAADGERIDGQSVEPLQAELPGTTNNRLEQDAKAQMQALTGLVIDGAVHVWGGRTS